MAATRLTERIIERFPAPDPSGKQTLHWDADLKGFGVLCSGTTKTKTFIAQRTLPDGRTRRVTVASVSEVSLSQARSDAAELLVAMRRGQDPKLRVPVATLQSALNTYLSKHSSLAESTRHDYRSQVERHLTGWLNKPLREIEREDVEKRHAAIAAEVGAAGRYKGEHTANSVMRVLRLLWNDAADRDKTLPQNPVRLKRQWFKEERREGVIQPEQMAAFYSAVCALPSPTARDYLLLLLFTGLRRTEAAELTWEHIDFTQRIIRIPASQTKAKRKLDLPMVDFVHDMLKARRSAGKDKFVFPSVGKSGHISEPKFPLDAVAKACGVSVTAHDLRRTYLTVAESVDISPLALKALVNHSLGQDVTEGYVRMTAERLRAPAQKIANKLTALCFPVVEGRGKVVAIA